MSPYVLVVQSDAGLQRLIADALREANYELSTEREATWAERSVLVRPPDAVVLDTRLGDGSGFRVAESLRRDPDTRSIPIFFVSTRSEGQAQTTEIRRRYQPAEVIPVPFEINTLLSHLLQRVPPPDMPARTRKPSIPPSVPVDAAAEAEAHRVEAHASSHGDHGEEHAEPVLGLLSRQSFAEVLRRLYASRRSGALLVVRENIKKIVYFREGYPVSVRSNVLTECLGQFLLQKRRLSVAQLDESLAVMTRDQRPQGEVLIAMGLLSPHALETSLVEQMEAKLFDLFGWSAGSFSFKDDREAPDEGVNLLRPTASLILEGIRRHYSSERIEQVLSAFFGRFPVPTSNPILQLQDMTVEPNERRFIAGVDGTQMLEAILNVPPIPKDRARAILCAMIESGMVESSDSPVEARNTSDRERRTSSVPPEGGKAEAELAAMLAAMRGQTHFEVLGISPDATPVEIESAYVRSARAHHPDLYRAREPEVRRLVAQIFDRIGEARSVLRDSTRRNAYLRRLERVRSTPGSDDQTVRLAEQAYYSGVEHMQARRFSQAIAALRNAIALVPGQANYHGTLGWAFYRQSPADPNAIASARAELQKAIALDEQDPWLMVSFGRFLSETGDVPAAIAALSQVLRMQPDLADVQAEVRRLSGTVQ
ncbi:MAG: DUF4388 domain-containing protein [Deltaproteobacteria bacterium]|nr:DUF4388 domain-containing protein [Deltaproteobacteria bacterium]